MFDISTYLDRITSQHKIKPKYMALLAARLQPFIDIAECLESFDAAFDLDNAVGKQLDTLGEYAGVRRLLDFQPYIESPVLQDHYYRMLIKAKISLNNWDGTVEGISRILGDVFPQYTLTVIDNQNMTLTVQIAGLESLFEGELITNGYITPKPMGVLVDYCFVFSIEVNTALYVGTLAHERVHNRVLPTPSPPEDNLKPTGGFYIAGRKAESIVGTTVMNKPFPAEIEPPLIDEYTYAGLLSNKRINTAIAEKPAMSAFDTLRESVCVGGIKATNTLICALPSAPI